MLKFKGVTGGLDRTTQNVEEGEEEAGEAGKLCLV